MADSQDNVHRGAGCFPLLWLTSRWYSSQRLQRRQAPVRSVLGRRVRRMHCVQERVNPWVRQLIQLALGAFDDLEAGRV
jgi:hypothetical protein